MHSSTSSFRPLPHAWRSLAIAAGLAAMWLGGYELLWRSRGFVPTLTNTEQLWCEARSRATGNAVVIAGSSRLQRGLDPRLMSRALGDRPVIQLAIDGGNPLPVLADLARDPAFAGVVVLEYMPKRWFLADSAGTSRTEAFVSTCANPSLVAGIEARLDRGLQRRFVFLSPELQLISLLSYVQHERALPRDSRDILRDDRFLEEHFAARTPAFQTDPWDDVLDEAALAARLAGMRTAAMVIRARGGCVIVYRSPVDGDTLRDEERHFPASLWFRRATEALGGAAIDFADMPELRAMQLPDGSHPDASQVPAITSAVSSRLDAVARMCRPAD